MLFSFWETYRQWKRSGTVVFCNIVFLILGSFLSARAQLPTITNISPATICQGETVTISGTDFTGATIVKLGNNNATDFTVKSPTSITATFSNVITNGTVTVTTPGGTITSTATLTILPVPVPVLTDIGSPDAPFTNCDGNSTYQLTVGNSSATNGTGNAYQINWGDNTASFTQTNWPANAQTTHTYTAQGYFNITLTITPQNGCTRSVTYRFYNGANPLGSFSTTSSTTGLCTPASVEFQIGNWFNNSTGTSYQVNFGDGSPDITLQHPLNPTNTVRLLSHIYTTSSCPNQDFTATLEAINGCFTTTYTLNQIIIRRKPEADFTIQPIPSCISNPVCFINQTTNGYSGNFCSMTSTFSWTFGDGTTSTAQTPSCHSYTTAGTYNVTLTASNATCGSSTKTKQVIVLPTSPPPVVSATPVVYCQGKPAVPLTATGTGLLWYTIPSGGTGNPSAPIPSTNTPGTTTWYVSQTLVNECESPRVPVSVIITALPGAPSVTTPVQLCQNQAASPLTASGTGLLWYTSAPGAIGSPIPPTPSTTTIGSTTWYVTQTTNGCEGPRASIIVTVNALAVVPVVTSPVTYCQNQLPVPLTAPGSGLLWYTVATGGVGSSIPPTPSTSTAGATTYYVSQVTGCGEGPRASITVNVNPGPSASISYNPAILCNVVNAPPAAPDLPVAVIQTGTPGGRYSISPATGLPIDPSTGAISPAGATAGAYTITYSVIGTGGCSNFTTTTTVTISGSPTAAITYPALCTADAAAPVNLTGIRGGIFTSVTGLTIDPSTGTITPATSTPGTYTVTYTISASSPCPGFVTTTSVTVTQAPSAAISYNPAILCNVNTPATPNPPVAVAQTGSPGGSYSISPSSGLHIDATTGQITPSGAIAGAYTIKYSVTGTGGCSNFTTTTTVTINSTPTAGINYPGSPYCRGITDPQPVSFSGTPGGTYHSGQGLSINATTGAIDPASSLPGTYTVTYTITPSSPCPGYIATTGIEIDESPILTFPTAVQSICSGETAVFPPSSTVPNTTYTWSVIGPLPANVAGVNAGMSSGPNPSIVLSFTNTGTGSQSLHIRVIPINPTSNPCPGPPYDLTLIVNPIPAAPASSTVDFCMGDPATALKVSPLPGTTIKWYDNNQVLLNAAPVISTTVPAQFIYYVSQTNSNGCESPKSKILAIVHPTAKIVSSSYTNPTTCGIPSGSVVLNVLDLNNNPIPDLPVLVHYDKFQTPYSIPESTDASGKITIPLVAGTYSGIYVETSSCLSQKIPDIFILKDPNPPAQPVAGYNPPICSETPLNLTALSPTSPQAGPIDYVWAGPAFGSFPDTVSDTFISFPSAAISDAGTYVVYAMQNNCISTPANFQVVIKQSPSKPIIATRNPLCIGDDLSLQAYSSIPGPDTELDYLWTGPGAGFPANTPNAGIHDVKIGDAGIYSITVNSPQTGCSSKTDTLIQIGGYPVVKFSKDTLTLPTGFLLNLVPVITNDADPGILPIVKYEWTPAQDLACNDAICSSPVATIKNNICYSVKATNSYGCSGSDVICVKVFCQSSQIFIPNAFTPKGDIPENRILTVRASGISSVRSFRVFNRWGKIVFERNNFPPNSPDFGWDGRVNGNPADPGVYIYTAEVVCENGIPYTFKGNVTLL